MTRISSLLIIMFCCAKSLLGDIAYTSERFTENSAQKALIFPTKTQRNLLRSAAIDLCAQNNATLVDIESADKQKIVLTFLHQILHITEYIYYWTGGYYDSGKYRWLSSGHVFNYTNCAYSAGNAQTPYTVIIGDYAESDGGWLSVTNYTMANVICEIKY